MNNLQAASFKIYELVTGTPLLNSDAGFYYVFY